ncbi:MAG: sodium:calcium antiporter, partial [Bacteroidales bacterium]|nr:sodium:calcium antiporter [Bacteroidales bacterium]
FNSMFILGITAVLAPMAITRTNRRTDIPVNILVTALLLALGLKQTLFSLGTDELGRIEGAALLALFVGYMVMSFVKGKGQQQEAAPGEKPVNTWLSILMAIGGIAALIIGGRFFVNSAVDLAKALGVSDKFIAITLLAGGTSLPELATCVVAAARKKGQLALGNIIGSNIFNILLILGGSAIITPLSFADINLVDAGALMLSALLIFTSAFIGRKNEIDRVDGALMLAAGIAYYTWLFIRL